MKFFALLFIVAIALADKVKVVAKVESKCPDCINFWTAGVGEFMQYEDLKDTIDMTILGYGKAMTLTLDPPTFYCQHGEPECYGNKVIDCGVQYVYEKQIEFTMCLSQNPSYSDEVIGNCINKIGAEEAMTEKILTCAKGAEGNKLHMAAGEATGSVSYVPYVTINGEFLGYNNKDFTLKVCQAIEGPKPASCAKVFGQSHLRK
ncbi:hypothetical protein WA158_005768 [Blastocystis sp. Blastoise]